jgi:hypothetical protein
MLLQQQQSSIQKSTHYPPSKKGKQVEEVRSEKIRVAVRIRPQLKFEVAKECVCHAIGSTGR